jgi:hypothetical protein
MPEKMMARAQVGPQRGRVAELLVAAELTSRGYIVSLTSPDAPYDLVAERVSDHRVFRVQCKTAYVNSRGREVFNTASTNGGRPRHQYDKDDFDVFAVVSSEGIFYLAHDEYTPRSSKVIDDDIRAQTEPPK